MPDLDSIESLITPQKPKITEEESVQAQLERKQREIKFKQVERQTAMLAQGLGMSYVSLVGFPISPEAISLIDEEEAKKEKIICFYYDGNNIRLGITDPNNSKAQEIMNKLTQETFSKGKMYLISEHSFEESLKVYKTLPKIKEVPGIVEIKAEDLDKFKNDIDSYQSLNDKINKVNISEIVTLLLATALKVGSSDIHIEAGFNDIVVRLRIDGILQEAARIDKKEWKKIVSRMKILAGVKINITDQPQDGRYTIISGNNKIDVRSSFLPTAYGESVVMRLLESESVGLAFEELGLIPQTFNILDKEISKPNGLILTTGPTGSGKTTTLYSILNKLNKPGVKIITLEDPIEYQLEGISQSQINQKKGYDFADGLRSILRQDPDIIMVGEIRDKETAEIAIQASLTGHLVLSTLHTNDASGAIPRLLDMGVKPYFIVPSINGIIGQRLVRKLCPECKVEHKLTDDETERVKKILAVISPKSGVDTPLELPIIYKPGEGCPHCEGLGYKGRIGIYEVFTMDDDIKELTVEKAPDFKIMEKAIENGMITMLQDGILKVLNGITSLEEVYRVIGKFDYIDELYDMVLSETINRGIKIGVEEAALGEKLSKDLNNIVNALEKVPTKEILAVVMSAAIQARAGDVHIEPGDSEVKIRFRIDGILHNVFSIPKDMYLPLLGEIKSLAGFPTNEKRASWDGRFAMFLNNQKMDSRISIVSGGFGETIVIRLLSIQASNLQMEDLGMKNYTLKIVEQVMQKTKGIVTLSGPTGSGKTTTLYAILNKLNKPDVKIITIEDPIEYSLPGIMQTQINQEQGYTFPMAIKSLLRQNPNIVMIGEIRDDETAEVAIDAAMTGHLIFSTIHANSGAGSIARFSSLNVDRQLIASSLECAIGQRLVRKLCPYCKQEHTLDEKTAAEVNEILKGINTKTVQLPENIKFYKSVGCPKCSNIGYKGRMGIYEAIKIDNEMKKLIQQPDVTDFDIEKLAMEHGTITLMQDGILKAINGDTTVEEVFRVSK